MIMNYELVNFDCLNYMLRNYAPFGGSFEYVFFHFWFESEGRPKDEVAWNLVSKAPVLAIPQGLADSLVFVMHLVEDWVSCLCKLRKKEIYLRRV